MCVCMLVSNICILVVPGPCDPDDLIDGIIFAATYLGCTHLLSERTPTKSARMQQAQEAMSRVRVSTNDKKQDFIATSFPQKLEKLKYFNSCIQLHVASDTAV